MSTVKLLISGPPQNTDILKSEKMAVQEFVKCCTKDRTQFVIPYKLFPNEFKNVLIIFMHEFESFI